MWLWFYAEGGFAGVLALRERVTMTWNNEAFERVVRQLLSFDKPWQVTFVRPPDLSLCWPSETATPPPIGIDKVDWRGLITELLDRWKASQDEIKALQNELAAYQLQEMLATIKEAKEQNPPEGAIIN